MKNSDKIFFLGSHTADGFTSYFRNCYNPRGGGRTYILKGGPGTGKSSLMKKAAAAARDKGLEVVFCPCSSDPDSLDAVLFPDIKTVILDGTAPHVVEPEMPGVCEKIVNLGEAFKVDGFYGKGEIICELCDKNSALHSAAAGYLSAAGKLLNDARHTARECADGEKIIKFSLNLAEKLIPKTKHKKLGNETFRFISVPTVGGAVHLSATPYLYTKKVILIEDEYRAASPLILDILKEKAREAGLDVITLKNPYLPTLPADGIIVPDIDVAVCTHSRYTDFSAVADDRMIHSRRFYNLSALRSLRSRLKFDRRAADEMIDSSVMKITEAKQVHDQIETHYIAAVDFEVTNRITENLINEIFR